ncbi:hypothetical protein AAMO2058_000041000 [Amorphochlora amoebiformis]
MCSARCSRRFIFSHPISAVVALSLSLVQVGALQHVRDASPIVPKSTSKPLPSEEKVYRLFPEHPLNSSLLSSLQALQNETQISLQPAALADPKVEHEEKGREEKVWADPEVSTVEDGTSNVKKSRQRSRVAGEVVGGPSRVREHGSSVDKPHHYGTMHTSSRSKVVYMSRNFAEVAAAVGENMRRFVAGEETEVAEARVVGNNFVFGYIEGVWSRLSDAVDVSVVQYIVFHCMGLILLWILFTCLDRFLAESEINMSGGDRFQNHLKFSPTLGGGLENLEALSRKKRGESHSFITPRRPTEVSKDCNENIFNEDTVQVM